MKVRFCAKSIPTYFIFFQIIYVCVVQLLIAVGCSSNITLICDATNVFLLIYLIKYYGKTKKTAYFCKMFLIPYLLFFIFGTISSLVYGFKCILWLWSLRNFGRFVVFFLSCCAFLRIQDLEKIKKILYQLAHINWLMVFFQFLILNKRGDYIGGLFGTSGGVANTWLHTFLMAVFILQFTDFLLNKSKPRKVIITLLEEISIAVVSELKFCFIEIAIVIIVGILFSRKTKTVMDKGILIICCGIIFISISIPFLYKMFPIFNHFFSVEVLYKTAIESYSGNGDLGRATAILDISKNIFGGEPFKIIMGIGLGNAEYSGGQRIFQSAFYSWYKYTNYFWFTDAVVMIQNGLVGVLLYISTFCALIMESLATSKKHPEISATQLTCILASIEGLLLFIYNISLNTESAYILYLLLAFGIVAKKESIRGSNG